jgi:hypothetical protein
MKDRRWLDEEISDALRSTLSSARVDDVRAEAQRASLEARLLGLGIGVGAQATPVEAATLAPSSAPAAQATLAASSGTAGISGASAWLAGGKIWLGMLVVAGVGAGGAWSVMTARGPKQRVPVVSSAAAAPSRQADATAPATGDTPQASPRSALAVAPGRVVDSSTVIAAAPAASSPQRAAVERLDLNEEVRLLDGMQAALDSAPETALRYARAHARAFPRGVLAAERELLRVQALLRSGRPAQARGVTGWLAQHYPASVYSRRAQRLIEEAGVDEDRADAKAQRTDPGAAPGGVSTSRLPPR